ncbi:MAG: hypothetical protein ACKOHM_02865 [Spartobacteria bacterium]
MKVFAALLAAFFLTASLPAEVVREAPSFAWTDSTGSAKPLKNLRGQPVVLVIANSPRQGAFRSQVGQLQKIYERFAAEKLLCVAAFSGEQDLIRSNIPFLTVPDGPGTAAAYDMPTGFAIAVIGPDGNLDCFSTRVLPAQRIFDIIQNSYTKQKQLRRD